MIYETLQRIGYNNTLVRNRVVGGESDTKIIAAVTGIGAALTQKFVNSDPSIVSTVGHMGEAGIIGTGLGLVVGAAVKIKNKVMIYDTNIQFQAQTQIDSLQNTSPVIVSQPRTVYDAHIAPTAPLGCGYFEPLTPTIPLEDDTPDLAPTVPLMQSPTMPWVRR